MTDAAANTERVLGTALALRLRQLRREHGLSLDALAQRAELSKGTVVAVEQGKANPSIGVLCRIAAAFSVSVADLLSAPAEGRSDHAIEWTNATILWTGPKGGTARLDAATPGPTMFELWSWILQPGEVFRSEAHSPGTRELISVAGGCLRITVGSETTIVKRGEAVRLKTDQPHSYAAEGGTPVRFAMAVLERGAP